MNEAKQNDKSKIASDDNFSCKRNQIAREIHQFENPREFFELIELDFELCVNCFAFLCYTNTKLLITLILLLG